MQEDLLKANLKLRPRSPCIDVVGAELRGDLTILAHAVLFNAVCPSEGLPESKPVSARAQSLRSRAASRRSPLQLRYSLLKTSMLSKHCVAAAVAPTAVSGRRATLPPAAVE